MTELEKLVADLDEYVSPGVRNEGLTPDGPTGPGTLKGFHATIAKVFRLGRGIGWDERSELDPDPDYKDDYKNGIDDQYVKRLMGLPQYRRRGDRL